MIIIAVGDTHGRTVWKDIAAEESHFDRFVFVGDYFDSREGISARAQIENFSDILDFKRTNPDKVVLLLGNHDFHYLRGAEERYSSYQPLKATDIQEILHRAVDEGLVQMCHAEDDIIFSHAGVSRTWCRNALGIESEEVTSAEDLARMTNELFRSGPEAFGFTPGATGDAYGDDETQTPIWIRPRSLAADRVRDLRQVVGHTCVLRIAIEDGIAFTDTLGVSGEYLVITNGVMGSKRLPV